MEIKVTAIIIAVVSLVAATPLEYSDGTVIKAGGAGPVYKQVEYQNEAPAEYDFSYSVHDEHTGDIKSHQESRKGDSVQGRYELIDSDGHRRIVEYTVDEHSGFNAVVHREPTDIRIPQPTPQIRHKIVSPPRTFSAPLAKYATPILTHHGLQENY